MMNQDFTARVAQREDCGTIFELMSEFAEYVKRTEFMTVNRQTLETELFVKNSAEVLIAEVGQKPMGYALYFDIFSSFSGRRGIYLEDLYISPDYRGQGYGKELLKILAKSLVEKGYERLEWACLNWNTPALEFYQSIGARPLNQLTFFSLEGGRLNDFVSLGDESEESERA